MDYSKLSLADITKNPKLLDEIKAELKSLAASGTQLQRISQQRKDEFNSSFFHNSVDAETAFDRLKVKPTLLDDFSLSFVDNIGRNISVKSVIQSVENEGMGHYLKKQKVATPNRVATPTAPTVPNPWETGNRTQQLLMMQSNPARAQSLKLAAGK